MKNLIDSNKVNVTPDDDLFENILLWYKEWLKQVLENEINNQQQQPEDKQGRQEADRLIELLEKAYKLYGNYVAQRKTIFDSAVVTAQVSLVSYKDSFLKEFPEMTEIIEQYKRFAE